MMRGRRDMRAMASKTYITDQTNSYINRSSKLVTVLDLQACLPSPQSKAQISLKLQMYAIVQLQALAMLSFTQKKVINR